jgi:hypothetical protein
MNTPVQMLSISRSIHDRLPTQPAPGRVQAVFERACLLSSLDGEPLSLVLPSIGDGPLNVVIPGAPGCFIRLAPGDACQISNRSLRAGDLEVDLNTARAWEPRPPWDHLRTQLPQVEARLDTLLALAASAAPAGGLLSLWTRDATTGGGVENSVWLAARQAGNLLRTGWPGNEGYARAAAAQLAGLGQGLTPAGDDFLVGLMLWAWLAHPDPQSFCEAVVCAAAPRTTALSAAFLQAAARGECSAAWHCLLEQLSAPEHSPLLPETVARVLSLGHTSGADTLAGFLWMAARTD